ncbi:MAG: substrate-binding domain-containing protein [Actinobacteria bacterium]|nr:substrate-binding domain-containing protein [Actinomycetota bacterium]
MVGLVLLGLLSWFGGRYFLGLQQAGRCSAGTVTMSVAAAPDIAPALGQIAAAMSPSERALGDQCFTTRVSAIDPAQVAAAQAAKSSDGRPDVWVPDSTLWLTRAAEGGATGVPEHGVSIASSPVAIGVAEPVARTLGWPAAPVGWGTLLSARTATSPVRVAITDPARSAVGMSGLLALSGAIAPKDQQGATFAAALRTLGGNRSAVLSDLFSKLPQSTDPTALAAAVVAFPASEQSIISFDIPHPPVNVVPIYPVPAGPALDYPFTVLDGVTDLVRQAADRLLAAVQGQQARGVLWTSGFRTPSGGTGAAFPPVDGVRSDPVEPIALPEPERARSLLGLWTTVNLPSRLLAVLDVSGSMAEPVPGTGKTRFDVTLQTAQQGLALFSDDSELGLWAFSTGLDGALPYRQLVPIGPLATQRAAILAAESAATVKANGGTGLYATTLAAYQAVLDGWDKTRANSVLIITDGQNDDPSGPTLDQALTALKKLVDPRRPVRVIFLGVGPDVSLAELDKIAAATHGLAVLATDPAKLSEVFLQALAARPCQPPNC